MSVQPLNFRVIQRRIPKIRLPTTWSNAHWATVSWAHESTVANRKNNGVHTARHLLPGNMPIWHIYYILVTLVSLVHATSASDTHPKSHFSSYSAIIRYPVSVALSSCALAIRRIHGHIQNARSDPVQWSMRTTHTELILCRTMDGTGTAKKIYKWSLSRGVIPILPVRHLAQLDDEDGIDRHNSSAHI